MTDERSTGGPSGPPFPDDLARVFAELEEAFTDAAKHGNLARLAPLESQLTRRAGHAFHAFARCLPEQGRFRLVLNVFGFDFTADRCPDAQARFLWEVACHMLAKTFPDRLNDPEEERGRLTESQVRYNRYLHEREGPHGLAVRKPLPLEDGDRIGILQFYLECYAGAARVCREIVEAPADGLCAPAAPDGWLTVKQAAQQSLIPDSTLSRACGEGRLNHVGKGRTRRIDPKDLDRFAEEHRSRL